MKKIEFCEVMGDINEDYIKSAHAPRIKRQPVWVKWGAMAACLCLIVTAVVALPQLAARPSLPDIDIVVNPLIGNHVSGDIDAKIEYYIDALYENYVDISEEEWHKLKEDFHMNIGMTYDDFISHIPAYLREKLAFYTLSTPSGNKDGKYILHDYIFDLKSDPDTKVELKVSHRGKPVRDWLLGNTKDGKSSNINGTSVTVYGGERCYIVQFEFNNVYYDITSYYMNLEQLKELLSSILYAE